MQSLKLLDQFSILSPNILKKVNCKSSKVDYYIGHMGFGSMQLQLAFLEAAYLWDCLKNPHFL